MHEQITYQVHILLSVIFFIDYLYFKELAYGIEF